MSEDKPVKLAEIKPALEQPSDVLTIYDCIACGEDHMAVSLKRYGKPRGGCTHWYTCPEAKEPCGLQVFGEDPSSGMIDTQAAEWLLRCQKGGQWMCVLFRVEKGRIWMDRRTVDFPKMDFQNCVTMLSGELLNEAGPPEEVELKEVIPKPRMKLFSSE